jgi:putative membrane protein
MVELEYWFLGGPQVRAAWTAKARNTGQLMRNLLDRPRFRTALKALLLLAMAAFLYTRLAGGTLFFYINERFMVYTMLAIVGLIVVAVSYRPQRTVAPQPAGDGHDHAGHEQAGHDHSLTWGGVALIVLPILLGVLVPPQPLGAAALSNREVNVSMQGSALPAAVRAAAQKDSTHKNVLDWLHSFAGSNDPALEYAGERARVTGFVFRDERFGENQFMVTRFVVSCCVADANVAGLVVDWPEAAALPADQWVEVAGTLKAGSLAGEALPLLAAQTVTPVEMPQQPYLYP